MQTRSAHAMLAIPHRRGAIQALASANFRCLDTASHPRDGCLGDFPIAVENRHPPKCGLECLEC